MKEDRKIRPLWSAAKARRDAGEGGFLSGHTPRRTAIRHLTSNNGQQAARSSKTQARPLASKLRHWLSGVLSRFGGAVGPRGDADAVAGAVGEDPAGGSAGFVD